MTETLEVDSAIENFKMPFVRVGQPVLWFPGGQRTGKDPHVAFVLKASTRNMTLKTIGGMRYDAVRHLDDPKLKMNEDQRENGAWDYTDEFKAQQKRWDEIQEQLAQMETRVKATEAANTALVAERARKGKSE